MKLIRFGNPGQEKPGLLLDNGKRVDASALTDNYDETFLANDGLSRLKTWADEHATIAPVVPEDVRWGAPIARPGNIICIGLNYRQHALESGMEAPDEPPIFFKASSSYAGPFDDVIIPKDSIKTDYEVELGVVIGKPLHGVTLENYTDYIAGYTLFNDYSERYMQIETSGQWAKGKGCDTFSPIGPFMATTDEIPDSSNLNLWLKVNGEQRQNSNTSDFITDVPHILVMLSEYMSLLPGDLISTGTPEGVGLGFDPPKYLKPGDIVEYGIENLGEGKQTLVAHKDQT